ncbi:MAG: hypothetical protein NC092_07330 [Butyrivibrio sp.]|nr:hypothetical protein [Muribaculum sp.]MCM1552489.1 hypothetical protein [Butyrivibrio sp.]
MANGHKANKVVKTVPVMLGAIAIGIVLSVVLIGLLSVLIPKYFDEPIREIRNFMYTEESGIKMAKKALQEKYGEEFIIHDVYSKSPSDFFADCSPVANEDVVFLAAIWKDGSGVVYDDYIPGIVARELEKELEDELKKYYDSVFVKVYHSGGSVVHSAEVDSMQGMTMEEYVKRFGASRCWIDIGIDAKEDNEHLAEEYAFFESMQEKISCEKMFSMHVVYYNMSKELQEWCNSYYTQYAGAHGTYDNKIAKCNKIQYECTAEGINITYDEFKTMMEELKDE